MTGIMQYAETPEHPAFQLTLQVNFVSGTGGSEVIRFIGDEGTIDIGGEGLTVHHSIMPKAPGIGGWDALTTYPKAMQETLVNKRPKDYDEHLEHHTNFFDSVRTGKPVVEDAVFGFRAAAPCLACNESYFKKKIIYWDPGIMKVKER
jgi:hypothetical protein